MTKSEQTRLWTWQFKVLQRAGEASRNVTRTCRHFGISWQAYDRWKRRFDEFGAAGLHDRPRAPHRSPRATAAAVVSKILYLRQTCHFGPGKIADYLKRFHQIAIARSTVHRILCDRQGTVVVVSRKTCEVLLFEVFEHTHEYTDRLQVASIQTADRPPFSKALERTVNVVGNKPGTDMWH